MRALSPIVVALLALTPLGAGAQEPLAVPEPPARAPATEPEVAWRVEGLGAVLDVLAVELEGEPHLVVRGAERLSLISESTGRLVGHWTYATSAILPGTGAALWVCGPDGAGALPMGADGFGEATWLQTGPCAALRPAAPVPSSRAQAAADGASPEHCDAVLAVMDGGIARLRDCRYPTSIAPESSDRRAPASADAAAPRAPSPEWSPPPVTAQGRTSSPGVFSSRRVNLPVLLDIDVEAARPHRPSRVVVCGLSLALSGGVNEVGRGWETLGGRWTTTASPLLAMTCEAAVHGRLAVIAGVETAPFSSYIVDRVNLVHGIVATTALGWSGDRGFVGGQLLTGFSVLGVGVTARWLPATLRSGARYGFEVRPAVLTTREFVGLLSVGLHIEFGARERAP